MRTIRFLMVIAVLGLGCRHQDRAAFERKADAALRLRVEELAHTDPNASVEILGRAAGAIDATRRKRLESAGAGLGQVTEDLFTATVPVKRILEVAALDFVVSLELSQTREPLGH
jgi:hypothetical protein